MVVTKVVVTCVVPAEERVVGTAVTSVEMIVVGNTVGTRVAACNAPDDKNVAMAALSLVTNV